MFSAVLLNESKNQTNKNETPPKTTKFQQDVTTCILQNTAFISKYCNAVCTANDTFNRQRIIIYVPPILLLNYIGDNRLYEKVPT